MEIGDRAFGLVLLLFSVSVFSYYTFWVLITPFVDSDHFVHNYFPNREFAVLIPGLAGVALLSLVMVFVGVVLVQSSLKTRKVKTS